METFIEKFRNSYHLSENDTQTLLSYMEEIRFKKKEVIVHEGSKNGNLYLIKQGIWRAHYLMEWTLPFGLPVQAKLPFRYGDMWKILHRTSRLKSCAIA